GAVAGHFGNAPEIETALPTHKSSLVSDGWSMSALAPEGDIRQRIEHVCFVPKAELACRYSRASPARDQKAYNRLAALIGDVEGGIACEEPARHKAKADGLGGHHRKILGPRYVRVTRGVPDHQVLIRQASSVLHELRQAGYRL